MYKLGFRGSVICSNATRDLCSIMLADSAYIQEHDTITFNKKRAKKDCHLVTPIYTQEDAKACMNLFIGVPNKMKFRIDDNVKVRSPVLVICLGSGVANIEINEDGKWKKNSLYCEISADRPIRYLLRRCHFLRPDYLITESTYGDSLHQPVEDAEEELLKVVIDTCRK